MLEVRLRAIVNPDEADHLAKADQRRRLDVVGGADAVIASDSLGYTPAPGEEPKYQR